MLLRLAILALLVVLVERSGIWQRPEPPLPPAGDVGWLAGGRGGDARDLRRETEGLLARTRRDGPQPPLEAPAAAEGGLAAEVPAGGPAGALAAGRVWVAPGLALRAAPEEKAAILGAVETLDRVPYRERRGDYFRIDHRESDGWVHLPGYDRGDPAAPPLGDRPDPPLPLQAIDPDPALLARARTLLGAKERRGRLGPYDLYTDARDEPLEALLGGLAAAAEPAYEKRYGREALGEAKAAVVLFAEEGTYRVFQGASAAADGSAGLNHLGVVALYAGGQPAEIVGATLVHELAHLLNRRALGPALPPWLDEGLCEDLSSSLILPGGGLATAEIGGRRQRQGSVVDWSGPVSSFHRLRERLQQRRLPGFRELASPAWQGFARIEGRRHSYDQAGAYFRYLIDGENGRRAPRLRAFLTAVAAGGRPDFEALAAALGEDGEAVEAGFRAWLLATAGRLLGS